MKKRTRVVIVNKKRFGIFCTCCALLLICVTAALTHTTLTHASEREYQLIYVGMGDTLWSIAKENYPSGVDVRSAIKDIKRANDLHSDIIHFGDALYIPIY